jgi:hypothetical protein
MQEVEQSKVKVAIATAQYNHVKAIEQVRPQKH